MKIYRVKHGDSLWTISQMFSVSMKSIINVNGLTQPNYLVIGMDLVIPINSIPYIVEPGDTLWSIGQKFNIPVFQIIILNNLQYPYIIYPGQVLVIYDNLQRKTVIETLGYYRPSSAQDDIFIINELGQYLTYLGIFDFPITSTGEILGELDLNMLMTARNKRVTVLPVLTNLSEGKFSAELARTVLSNTDSLNNLINNILAFLQEYNLQGIIIDFENLYPEDRDLFTQFIQLLSQELHENNKILVVNLAPKWEDWPEREWVGFFDYNSIGEYIDIAAIMTYEWGWREGSPRPTAPLANIRRSLDYAIANNIPPDKILMGMTLYGYDWELPDTPENLATTVTLPQVWDLARTYNSRIYFDKEAKQPYMDYINTNNKNHQVWFENARSHYLKYQLVKDYGLRGVFYWILNQPFPSTWYILSNLFKIRKL